MIAFSRRFSGYDTQEVDDYVARLTQYGQHLEERTAAAERSLAKCSSELAEARRRLAVGSGADLPARLGQILALAEEEAHDIRERARVETRAITDQAVRDAEEMLIEATEERSAIERQVQQLAATRDSFLDDLRSLGAQMAHAAQHYEIESETPEPVDERVEVFDAEALEPLPVAEAHEQSDDAGDDADVPLDQLDELDQEATTPVPEPAARS
jgi:DivIVA domain-containing protein